MSTMHNLRSARRSAFRLRPHVVSACALAVLACCPTARADLVTFAFTGEVDFVMDSSNLLGGNVVIGTPISGTYTFDSTTADASPDPRFGGYIGAVQMLDGTLGPFAYSGPSGPENRIGISNLSTDDSYSAIIGAMLQGHLVQFSVSIADDEAAIFTTDALPLVPPSLQVLESKNIGFVAEDIGLNVHGQLTSLTRIPEPIFSGGVALIGVLFMRRGARSRR